MQGTGKTTWFQFLTGLFGQKLVIFLLDLSRMHCRFNSWQMGCLFLCCDDLTTATKVQIDKCKARISSTRYPYEVKNGKTMQAQNFEEYWFSSNNTRDIFVDAQDRRGVFLTCSNEFHQNKEFFDQIYSELDDRDVMKAFWELFTNWKPPAGFDAKSQKCDPIVCKTEKGAAKALCAKNAHKFVIDFFADEEFPTMYLKLGYNNRDEDRTAWLKNYDIQVLANHAERDADRRWPAGTVRICIKAKHLYQVYKRWYADMCPGSKRGGRNADTFWSELSELGISKSSGRIQFNDGRNVRSVVLLYQEGVKEGFRRHYETKVVPDIIEEWVTQSEETYTRVQKVIKNEVEFGFVDPMGQ